MATTHCSVFVSKRVYCLASPASSMDRVASMADEWLWLDERAIFQSASKNIALHLEEGLEVKLWDPLEDDNWALGLGKELRDTKKRASSTDSVAGMVAQWLSLDEWLVFQSLGSFHFSSSWSSLDLARQRLGTGCATKAQGKRVRCFSRLMFTGACGS